MTALLAIAVIILSLILILLMCFFVPAAGIVVIDFLIVLVSMWHMRQELRL